MIGCGGVGLSAIEGAFIAGASRVIAVDRIASRLERARKLGATDVVDASAVDPVEAVRELTGGGVDYSFEVVGAKLTSEQAFQMLGRMGRRRSSGFRRRGRWRSACATCRPGSGTSRGA